AFPVISTGRKFAYYRRTFFDSRSESEVLNSVKDKIIVDIGCGLTPYITESMFQVCRQNNIDFFGVDPKLKEGFKFGLFDKLKVIIIGGSGSIDSNAKGLEKGIATLADDLPFKEESTDLILSCFLIYAWINDETILENIFREFHRVLKPGGQIKIYPTPHLNFLKAKTPEFSEIISNFEIEQKFSGLHFRPITYPPSYTTTYTKK
ncbi:MAG: methyltransferase domain-containing protein, partial [Pseudomonadales bacterium]|nr:methyltransferase domain-containing protein [Pseudomonadales bacterium]